MCLSFQQKEKKSNLSLKINKFITLKVQIVFLRSYFFIHCEVHCQKILNWKILFPKQPKISQKQKIPIDIKQNDNLRWFIQNIKINFKYVLFSSHKINFKLTGILPCDVLQFPRWSSHHTATNHYDLQRDGSHSDEKYVVFVLYRIPTNPDKA